MAIATEKLTLSDLSTPQPVRITELDLSLDDALRLKVLGICVGRDVELVQIGSPLVVEVCGAQIGISRRLACGIVVSPR